MFRHPYRPDQLVLVNTPIQGPDLHRLILAYPVNGILDSLQGSCSSYLPLFKTSYFV